MGVGLEGETEKAGGFPRFRVHSNKHVGWEEGP